MKRMIGWIALALAAVLLAGCGAQTQDTAPTAALQAKTLKELAEEAAADAKDMVPLTAEDLSDVLGIEPEEYTEFIYLQDNGLGGREILALRCTDADAAGRVAEKVSNYLEQRRKETKNYLPEAYQLLAAAKVETKGLTVALISGEKAAEETKAILAGE